MYLSFISDNDLIDLCKEVINTLDKAIENKQKDLYKNIIDPFSAVFEASYYDISLTEWIEREKSRQIQKSFQNAVGNFHQKLIGKISGWNDLGVGEVVDLRNDERKIIAEIKNKFNTTKGNHRTAIYDDLDKLIKTRYLGYTGYYVSILNKNKINKPFQPSDNKIHDRRKLNDNIREVDGATFYEIVTNEHNAIKKIYDILPLVITHIVGNKSNRILKDPLFHSLYNKAFK
jgi:hypothetical protein